MARNPTDNKRRTTIERNGAPIYTSDAMPPAPAACFTPDIQQFILHKTAFDLCVPHNMQPAFWGQVAECCRTFAREAQYEAATQPSAAQIEKARSAAERLKIAMHPILGQYPTDNDLELFGRLHTFVDVLDHGYPKRTTKRKNHAARVFIAEMGGMFAAAFEREPSEDAEGPFARFIIACLSKTDGLPETPSSGHWVRKYVQEHKDAASRRSNALWGLGEHRAWDDAL